MHAFDDYVKCVAPIRKKYQSDFVALEARWTARRQAVIDYAERVLGGGVAIPQGLIDFHSDPIDNAHERAVAALSESYYCATEALRLELGL